MAGEGVGIRPISPALIEVVPNSKGRLWTERDVALALCLRREVARHPVVDFSPHEKELIHCCRCDLIRRRWPTQLKKASGSMIFFSNKTRPFHYGPYPIERLKRDKVSVAELQSLLCVRCVCHLPQNDYVSPKISNHSIFSIHDGAGTTHTIDALQNEILDTREICGEITFFVGVEDKFDKIS